jgi:hypothetical protein
MDSKQCSKVPDPPLPFRSTLDATLNSMTPVSPSLNMSATYKTYQHRTGSISPRIFVSDRPGSFPAIPPGATGMKMLLLIPDDITFIPLTLVLHNLPYACI